MGSKDNLVCIYVYILQCDMMYSRGCLCGNCCEYKGLEGLNELVVVVGRRVGII